MRRGQIDALSEDRFNLLSMAVMLASGEVDRQPHTAINNSGVRLDRRRSLLFARFGPNPTVTRSIDFDVRAG